MFITCPLTETVKLCSFVPLKYKIEKNSRLCNFLLAAGQIIR